MRSESISRAILAPASARKLYAKAREAFLSGHQDDAKKLLQQALDIDPQYADALTLRGLRITAISPTNIYAFGSYFTEKRIRESDDSASALEWNQLDNRA